MRTLTRLTASGFVAAAMIATTASGAHAQSTTVKDKRADVLYYASADATKPEVLGKSASIKSGVDVTKVKYDYSKKRLKVKISFSKLASSKVYFTTYVSFKGAQWGPNFVISNNGSKKKAKVLDGATNKNVCSAKLKRDTGNKGSISFEFKRKCFDTKQPLAFLTVVSADKSGKNPDGAYYIENVSPKKVKQATFTKFLKAN
jgi:hypothetical protein